MDRYQKVEKPRPESVIKENEIRITSQGVVRNYVSYATSLLQETRVREIVLKAMGQAISKAVAIAEIIKKRNPGLYQDTTISSVSITDVWEPIEEGLVPGWIVPKLLILSLQFGDNTSCFNDFNLIVNQRAQQELPWIRMYEDVVEVEEEEEGGDGEEVMVDMVDMTTTRVAMATTKEDMVAMATIKVDMVDTTMIKKMVDGTQIGVEVVDVVEVAGIILVSSSNHLCGFIHLLCQIVRLYT
ncbi:Alba [Musa troglodytarum]|uniref:Alba n=1 Tax=Musa troglodytarum TaxID=320322 RepID=A0A9E7HGB6_9LILI|nr:Alba [Musa troglodytarum]